MTFDEFLDAPIVSGKGKKVSLREIIEEWADEYMIENKIIVQTLRRHWNGLPEEKTRPHARY